MFEVQPSRSKKYQNIAGIVGCIGFVLGVVISGAGILLKYWDCPFGDGMLQTVGFSILIGLSCGIVLGNLVAILLVWHAKMRQVSRKTSRD